MGVQWLQLWSELGAEPQNLAHQVRAQEVSTLGLDLGPLRVNALSCLGEPPEGGCSVSRQMERTAGER